MPKLMEFGALINLLGQHPRNGQQHVWPNLHPEVTASDFDGPAILVSADRTSDQPI